jgi:hypothetical protein
LEEYVNIGLDAGVSDDAFSCWLLSPHANTSISHCLFYAAEYQYLLYLYMAHVLLMKWSIASKGIFSRMGQMLFFLAISLNLEMRVSFYVI